MSIRLTEEPAEEKRKGFPDSDESREASKYGQMISTVLGCYAYRSWTGSSRYNMTWDTLPGVFGSYRHDYNRGRGLNYSSHFCITLNRRGHDDWIMQIVKVQEFDDPKPWRLLLEWLGRQKKLEAEYLAPFPKLYEQLQSLLKSAGFTLDEYKEHHIGYSNHRNSWGAMEAPRPKSFVCGNCYGDMLMMRHDWYRSFNVAIKIYSKKNGTDGYFEFAQDEWTNEKMIKTLIDWMNK
jgi:hypothetical protein